jgi:hypothetical protein
VTHWVERRVSLAATIRGSAAAGPSSTADELTKLAALRDQGILSDEEFAQQKAKLLT